MSDTKYGGGGKKPSIPSGGTVPGPKTPSSGGKPPMPPKSSNCKYGNC